MPALWAQKHTPSARWRALKSVALAVPALATTALAPASPAAASVHRAPAATSGGTVTQGIVGVAPGYIFPVAPLRAPTSGTNTERFNWLMYPRSTRSATPASIPATASLSRPCTATATRRSRCTCAAPSGRTANPSRAAMWRSSTTL